MSHRNAHRHITALTLAGTLAWAGAAHAQWSSPHTISARAHMAATTVGDKALFFGGVGSYSFCPTFSRTVDIYDGATGTWSSSEPLFTDLLNVVATSVGTRALFAGGLESDCPWGTHYRSEVSIYDDATGSWSIEHLSSQRVGHFATSVGTLAIFAGGGNAVSIVDTVDIYDDAAGTWSTASLSVPRAYGAAATVGDLAFFAGGRNGSGYRSEVDIYNHATGTWSTDVLPNAIGATTATAVGARVMFCNGSLVDTYDVSTGTWYTTLLSRRRSGPVAVTAGNLALFAGGIVRDPSGYEQTDETVDVYDDDLQAWRVETLPRPHGKNLSAVSLGGRAIFAGGGVSDYADHLAFGAVDFYGPIIGQSYCGPAVPNSTGLPGAVTASGNAAAAANDVTLWVQDLPPNEFGILIGGRTQGYVPLPGGSILCLGGSIGRFDVQDSGAAGAVDVPIDLTSMPPPLQMTVIPGETWYFQYWTRDGSSSNFTDAERVLFH
ncbi:MAG: hypothetical protein GY711_11785 [bacterium]|nr:hypothetical protein [bacterium]